MSKTLAFFLGIDFGWQGKPTGLAAFHWDGSKLVLVDRCRRDTCAEILDWVKSNRLDRPGVIGVDAPTIITNATGMREADRLMHCLYGKYHAGCYPANLSRPWAMRTIRLGVALEEAGFSHGYDLEPAADRRCQIEVHPGAATVQLFGLSKTIKYKRGLLKERAAELRRFLGLLENNLLVPRFPDPAVRDFPSGTLALKKLEDELDAMMCAYVAAQWWLYGRGRNAVIGHGPAGYLIVPERFSPTVDRRLAGLIEALPLSETTNGVAHRGNLGIKRP